MTRVATGKPEFDTIFAWTSCAEEAESHVGMTKRFATKEILVANFNSHILGKFVQFLYWDLHVLELPSGIFATINTDCRSPLLSVSDFDPDEGILFIQRTTSVDFQVRALDNKSQETLSWHHKAHRLLLHDNLRLHESLGLCDDDLGLNERLLVDNDSGTTHSDEFGATVKESSSIELNSLFSGTLLGENSQWDVCLANGLQGVSLIFNDDVHVLLEHSNGDFHEGHHPPGLLSAFLADGRVPHHIADLDVNEGRHLVKGSTDFVVQLSI